MSNNLKHDLHLPLPLFMFDGCQLKLREQINQKQSYTLGRSFLKSTVEMLDHYLYSLPFLNAFLLSFNAVNRKS